MDAAPLLTVCICTRNRPGYLRDCLDGLRWQTSLADRFETLVVDSASDPAEANAIRWMIATPPFPGPLPQGDGEKKAPSGGRGLAERSLRLLRLETPGLSLARNAGARAARADYICYIDDDAVPAPDLVEAALRAITAQPPPALIGGRVLPALGSAAAALVATPATRRPVDHRGRR